MNQKRSKVENTKSSARREGDEREMGERWERDEREMREREGNKRIASLVDPFINLSLPVAI